MICTIMVEIGEECRYWTCPILRKYYTIYITDRTSHYWENITDRWFSFMVFNATFNNISVISWQSVLLEEETGVPWENHQPATSHWQTLSHNVVHLAWAGFELTISVVIGTDCTGSCKSTTIRSRPRRPLCRKCITCYPFMIMISIYALL